MLIFQTPEPTGNFAIVIRVSSVVLALFLFVPYAVVAKGQERSASLLTSAVTTDDNPQAQKPAPRRVADYTLSPDKYLRAHELGRIYFCYQLLTFLLVVVVIWVILRVRVAVTIRKWSEHVSGHSFIQSLVFAPLLILVIEGFLLPADVFHHWLRKYYGLSIQGWRSWFWDWTKEQFVLIVVGTIVLWLLYTVIRRSARLCWLYFWIVSLPLGLGLVFLQPLVFDPLFHKFEPLQKKDPAVAEALEKLVQHARVDIPLERIYWMEAGNKTTTLNAYVTGFGTSKRIVVWDTTIAQLNTPQVVFVASHEVGHYVLQHILKGFIFSALMLLIAFYLGYRLSRYILKRWGNKWEIRGLDDWASLPVLLLILTVFAFVSSPVVSAVSRYYEHQADQYALEVTEGLTPDSAQVGAQAFQVMGEASLSDPDPVSLNVFMFYDHPPIRDRVRFCLTYGPLARPETH